MQFKEITNPLDVVIGSDLDVVLDAFLDVVVRACQHRASEAPTDPTDPLGRLCLHENLLDDGALNAM